MTANVNKVISTSKALSNDRCATNQYEPNDMIIIILNELLAKKSHTYNCK